MLRITGQSVTNQDLAQDCAVRPAGEVHVRCRPLHPEFKLQSATPPDGVSQKIWDAVRLNVPWMYHAGCLPWPESSRGNDHEWHDTSHFFSHAWFAYYDLFRKRHFRKGLVGQGTFATRRLTRGQIRSQLGNTHLMGLGYEFMTMVAKSGFLDLTPVEELPEGLRPIARALGLKSLPVVEAVRDMGVNRAGATFGAALAVSRDPLPATKGALHAEILRKYR